MIRYMVRDGVPDSTICRVVGVPLSEVVLVRRTRRRSRAELDRLNARNRARNFERLRQLWEARREG